MELVKIKQLLDAYFEGTTSLAEEKLLRDYFSKDEVDTDLLQYQPIFKGLKAAKAERSERTFNFGEPKAKTIKTYWYSVAAMLIVAIGVGAFYFTQPQYTQEEKEALAAFEESKKAMLLLSENLNRGAEQLNLVEQFQNTKDKIFE